MVFSFILDYDYMCSETDFTQEKSHFYPILEFPILLYCLLLCHKIVEQQYSGSVKDMKNAFLRPLTVRKNVFWVSIDQTSMKK